MSENALALARQHAPCYIYSREILTAQAETLHRTFPGFDILFSVKANPFPPVIRHLAALGIGADAASAGEVRLAAECGIAQEDIYFSAAGKSDRALAAAWDNCHLIADSIGEVRRIAAMAAARGETKAIGLRVNPAFSMDGGAGGTSKFGIDESDLPALKTLLQTLPIAVCGLHIHLRSQNLSADTLARYYKNCFALALRVRDILDCAIEYINFGGGVGIVYDPACQPPLNMSTLKQCTQAVAEENARTLRARLLVESGRFLTAQAGTYYLPVVDKKTSHGTTYVIVENCLNGFQKLSLAAMLRNAAGEGPLAPQEPLFTGETAFPITALPAEDTGITETVDIAGNLCCAADVLAKNFTGPALAVGDLVAVGNTGGNAVERLEGAGKGLLPGKAVVQRDVQQRPVGIAHLLQGKGQAPLVQVGTQGHTRDLAEFMGGVVLRIVQTCRQRPQCQRLIVPAHNGVVHLIDDGLDQLLPFVHRLAPFSRCEQNTPFPPQMFDTSCC